MNPTSATVGPPVAAMELPKLLGMKKAPMAATAEVKPIAAAIR